MLGLIYIHFIQLIFIVAGYLIWYRETETFFISYLYLYLPTMVITALVVHDIVEYNYINSLRYKLDKYLNIREETPLEIKSEVENFLDYKVTSFDTLYCGVFIISAIILVIGDLCNSTIVNIIAISVIPIGLIIYDILSVSELRKLPEIDTKCAIKITCYQSTRYLNQALAKFGMVLLVIVLFELAIVGALVGGFIFFKWIGEIFGDNE